jgi:hypothetical protein
VAEISGVSCAIIEEAGVGDYLDLQCPEHRHLWP